MTTVSEQGDRTKPGKGFRSNTTDRQSNDAGDAGYVLEAARD